MHWPFWQDPPVQGVQAVPPVPQLVVCKLTGMRPRTGSQQPLGQDPQAWGVPVLPVLGTHS